MCITVTAFFFSQRKKKKKKRNEDIAEGTFTSVLKAVSYDKVQHDILKLLFEKIQHSSACIFRLVTICTPMKV